MAPRWLPRLRPLPLALAAIGCAALPGPGHAQVTTEWLGGTWTDPAAWSNGLPDAGKRAVVNASAFIATDTVMGSLEGATGSLIFSGASPLLLTVGGDHTDSTFQGQLLDQVSLIKVGMGILTLSRNNSYVGDTVVQAGTLRAESDPAVLGGGTSRIVVHPGATLEVDASGRVRIQGLDGAGRVVLTSGGLDIADAADTFSGSISGSGGVTVRRGLQILTGENTYTGATNISSTGTLQIGDGGTTGSLPQASLVTVRGILRFNRNDDVSHGGLITGDGTLVKEGPGTLTITRDISPGVTQINAGTLQVASGVFLSNRVHVNTGGTLSGSGQGGSVTVNGGGAIAPGPGLQTLSVGSFLVFQPDARYRVEVDASGASDHIAVTNNGYAVLDGVVQVLAAPGRYAPGTTYTILTASGGLGGTRFAGVSSNLAFLDPTLSYDASNVYLELRRNSVAFTDIAQTPNQLAVATAIVDAANAGSDLTLTTDAITQLPAVQARAAYDAIGGAGLVALRRAGPAFAQRFGDQMQARLQADALPGAVPPGFNSLPLAATARTHGRLRALLSPPVPMRTLGATPDDAAGAATRRGLWAGGWGSDEASASDGNAAGHDLRDTGLALGADAELRSGLVLGLAAGQGRSTVRTDLGEHGTADGTALGVYARQTIGPWTVRGHLGYAQQRHAMHRPIALGGNPGADARFDSRTLSAHAEIGRDVRLGGQWWQPFAGMSLSRQRSGAFTETGAGALNLSVDEATVNSARIHLGARARIELGRVQLMPRLSWTHELADANRPLRARWQGAPTAFEVVGTELSRNGLQAGIGLQARLSERLHVLADLQAAHDARRTRVAAMVGLRADW